ncbi:ribonuclease HII [Collinsella sp. zg1085]|uniref:ribonuclease HII n=1 Tax=Collinsella sp. zg1085 TaxID=2844380 RepID=UPI001C0D7822|nr:ribonuclease HII [Collinsella sp. zg1085]QWT17043.1 ribonuclease HII [Collinsella sp. zg1085]
MAHTHTASAVIAELNSAPLEVVPELVALFRDDPRSSVQKACQRALRRIERAQLESERVHGLYLDMLELGGEGIVLGVDEVGRGSLAGPLTVCALQLPHAPEIQGLNDSKKLSPQQRSVLSAQILELADAVGICHIEPADIDAQGITQSLRRAVVGAIADTGVNPDCVLMDGNPLGAHERERNVVHGDARVACIAAASIVAKVARDELMIELDKVYPGYFLAESKGYASPQHIKAIQEKGLSPLHRVSFCGNFLQNLSLF